MRIGSKNEKQQQFTTCEVVIQSKNCGLDYLTCFVHKHSIIFNFIYAAPSQQQSAQSTLYCIVKTPQ